MMLSLNKLITQIMQLLLAPPDSPSGTPVVNSPIGTPSGSDKESMIEFLSDDGDAEDVIPLDDKTKEAPPLKEPKVKPEVKEEDDTEEDDEDDEDDELKDIEEELEGPTDDQLELVTPVRRREILKKYPELFKDFPYLEKAYYREQQFTEVFPTINDAKEASDKAQTLDKFDKDINSGNTETLLKMVKDKSPESFNKIVDNYLITLSKVDSGAYHHVLGNTVKHTVAAMVNEARNSRDENLYNAALVLNKFIFGSVELKAPENLSKGNSDKTAEDAVTKREREFTQRRFETTRDDLNGKVDNSLKATIEANIDPRDSMTDYVKKNASREAMESVTNLISKDSRFKNLLNRLWESAFEKDFDKASTDRIRAAYLSKAKTLLPSVIKKARNDALRGMGKRPRDDDNDTNNTKEETKETRPTIGPKKKEMPSSRNTSDGRKSTGRITNAKDIPAGMRSVDFLLQDD